jgi:hypothetical protein
MDRTEITEVSGITDMHEALGSLLGPCEPCHTLFVEDDMVNPVAVCGVNPFSPGVGVVWCLGKDACFSGRGGRSLLRSTRQWLSEQHATYPTLFNYVRFNNTDSIRWLQWSGFNFPGDTAFFAGQPYFLFERTTP